MTLLLLGLCGLYVLVLLALVVFQRRILYQPDKDIASPGEYGLSGFEERFIESGDGTRLLLWQRPAADGMPTVIYFHGNAYHLGSRVDILAALAARGFGVVALSYRGYGKSGGTPSEQGIYADARATIGHVTGTLGIPLGRVVLFGESLGTGVAVQMATEFHVGVLALQSPYISVAQRAAEIYFFIPVKLLIRDHFHSLAKIGRVRAPLALFHGERDATIPLAHGQAVFAAANEPKQAWIFPEVDHVDFDADVVASHVLEFTRKHMH